MTAPSSAPIVPVILSGGAGTRLWPLSRVDRPKQFQPLIGPDTLLRETGRRVGDAALYRPAIVVAAASQAEKVESEVERLERLILEPSARNTAAAIALAALNVDPAAVLLILPSDHRIADGAGFDAAVRRALPFAQDGWIVTFGMKPSRPETGFGYIHRGAGLGEGVFEALSFIEKPDAELARSLLASGDHDWNGGIFLMRADVALEGLSRHAPAVASAARAAARGAREQGRRWIPDAAAFAAAPSISIDHALMEKATRIAVVPVEIGWSDIGSWEALHALAAPGEDGNAIRGEAIAIDVHNCLIRSDGPLVATIGVEDLVIVATRDAVLVVPRGESQRVREIVERLKRDGKIQWT